ncbi:MAG: helix-turn-helix domain-containing protein [Anaerolineaceae bacterium]
MPVVTGSKLKQVREEQYISLEQVASATHIRLSILRDLEDEEYGELGSATQVRGFLKLYSEYLGIAPDEKEEAQQPFPVPVEEPAVPVEEVPTPIRKTAQDSFIAKIKKKAAIKKKSRWQIRNLVKKKSVPDSSTKSQQILDAIGRDLFARRRYLNVPWELIVEQTHIPQIQLQALEQGNLDAFVTPMQAKGLLQSYARFLSLDANMLLIRFADALQERRAENVVPGKKSRKKARITPPFVVTIKRFFTLDLLFGTLLVVGIVLFLGWGVVQMIDRPANTKVGTDLPEVADVLIGSQTPLSPELTSTTESAAQSVRLPTITPFYVPITSDAAIQVVVHVTQTVWVRIIADGKEIFQGRLQAGSADAYTADEYLELEAGNAAALDIVFNQNQMEPVGSMGEIARLRFDQTGMSEVQTLSSGQITPTVSP